MTEKIPEQPAAIPADLKGFDRVRVIGHKARSVALTPKLSSRVVIEEIAEHTGTKYETAAAVVYAFLHFVKYVPFTTGERIVLRSFGSFYQGKAKGRTYGAHIGMTKFVPDRLKLGLETDLIERKRWKNTLSIHKNILSALSATLRPSSMDLSVCARIVDLVLSNKPISSLEGLGKVDLVRQWIQATGAAPLLPSTSVKYDHLDRQYHPIKFRLHGALIRAFVVDFDITKLDAVALYKNERDVFFMPTGWASAQQLKALETVLQTKNESLKTVPYGTNPEETCSALYQAYRTCKYGEKQNTNEGQENQESGDDDD